MRNGCSLSAGRTGRPSCRPPDGLEFPSSGAAPRRSARWNLIPAALCCWLLAGGFTAAQDAGPLRQAAQGPNEQRVLEPFVPPFDPRLPPAADAADLAPDGPADWPSVLPGVDQMLSPGGMSSTLRLMLLLTVLSLAPAILMMTTCFIRFVVVLGLLRQAIGTQQLPPNQVIVSLCLFLTLLVMAPVWKEAWDVGIAPYNDPAVRVLPGQQPGEDRLTRAFKNTVAPLRRFMSGQIELTGNSDAVWMFLEFQRPDPDSPEAATWREPETYEDLDLSVLLPAYMLSELKTAFVIGFQVYLPFIVIDMAVASVLISMGMMMLPPVLVSLPFKLLLFVMIDGWYLTVGMLLESVRPFG